MTRYLLALLLLAVPFTASAQKAQPAALAAPALGIVATVNDAPITSADLDGRLRLALLGSGVTLTEEVAVRLRGQVLRSLIEEQLQLQEATRVGVSVTDEMINDELAAMAQRNNQKPGELPAFFAKNQVPLSALRNQLRASLTWGLMVQRQLRPRVTITDRDVDAELARLSAAIGQPEYLAAEIFLPVPRGTPEESVQQVGLKLIEQMARGARFSGIAREFSQAPSAARGGDLGWVRVGQLEPELDTALRGLKPGMLTPPIRTASGYTILMLREQRILSAPEGGEQALREQIANTLGAQRLELLARRALRDLRQDAFIDIRG